MQWPPITMATQHPDNASVPWWRSDAFIPTADEIDELMLLYKELQIDEYMWDWEGKYVDESVGEKLFARERDYFLRRPLGSDLHLTYRIPALADGKIHRMARAFMNVLSMADLGRDIGLPAPPVTEMFLPLTMSAEQPLQVRKAFREIADYHRAVFHQSQSQEQAILDRFEVTPLVEDVDSLFAIEDIVQPYWESMTKERDMQDRGQRIFLARSDPALNAGLVPAVLAVKAALSVTEAIGAELGFPVHPVIGTGSLPFRGSVNPLYVDSFLTQYAGVRTYSIQSAFRYDYARADVEKALATIKSEAPKRSVQPVPTDDLKRLRELSDVFAGFWKPTIEGIAGLINAVAAHVPPRRERLQHIGLFGYSRGVGKVKLPRAIGFTAALYSVGVPPELISTGRGLRAAKERGDLPLLDAYYPMLREDMRHAGKYFNRENLELFARRDDAFKEIEKDVAGIEEILGVELKPEKPQHVIHRNITSTIFHRLHGEVDPHAIREDIVEAGVIRRSLG